MIEAIFTSRTGMQGMKKQIPNVFPFGAQTSVELVPLRSTHDASVNGSALEHGESGPDNRRRACAAVSLRRRLQPHVAAAAAPFS